MTHEDIKEGYTRISDIASSFSRYHAIDPAVLKNAADRGTAVHDIIFDLMNDIPVGNERYTWLGKEMALKGYVDSYLRFWERYENCTILNQEARLYCDDLKVTGQMDLIIEKEGKMILIDWKCSYKAAKHWQIQAGGYNHLHKNKLDEIYFVRLPKDGKDAEVISYDCFSCTDMFKRAYDFYKMFFEGQELNMEME